MDGAPHRYPADNLTEAPELVPEHDPRGLILVVFPPPAPADEPHATIEIILERESSSAWTWRTSRPKRQGRPSARKRNRISDHSGPRLKQLIAGVIAALVAMTAIGGSANVSAAGDAAAHFSAHVQGHLDLSFGQWIVLVLAVLFAAGLSLPRLGKRHRRSRRR
jgi:hypothetical protein